MLRSFSLIFYNFLRIIWLKFRHPGKFSCEFVQRISPLCALKFFEKGQMLIGRNVEFAPYCDFEVHGKGRLTIGAKTYFNRYCMISAHECVKIGEGCMFGPGVKIFDNNHKHSAETGVSTELTTAPIIIGNHCWIASDSIILKGTVIGDNCVIGAGMVVRGNIPAGSVLHQ